MKKYNRANWAILLIILVSGFLYYVNLEPQHKLTSKNSQYVKSTSAKIYLSETKRNELNIDRMRDQTLISSDGKIEELAKKYSRDELELLSSSSKLNLNLEKVTTFISKTKDVKSYNEMIGISRELSKDDFALELEFVRYTNKRFPQKPIQPKKSKSEFRASNIFNKVKKN